MNIIKNIATFRNLKRTWPEEELIAFVPTMGNLHAGHLELIKKAKKLAHRTIVSIFVNPLQFAPTEDFKIYPRTESDDLAQLKSLQVDAVFLPELKEIYPDLTLPSTRVIVPDLSDELCGKFRPQHFEGVTTIVTKLFHIVAPNIAIFGEKDFQQLTLIKKMVKDLNFPIEIISVPIIREPDGLAMSSRNQFLNATERKIAPQFYKTLCWLCKEINADREAYEVLCTKAQEHLEKQGFKVDYVTVRSADTLKNPISKDNNLIILAAAFLGRTRLIDNVLI